MPVLRHQVRPGGNQEGPQAAPGLRRTLQMWASTLLDRPTCVWWSFRDTQIPGSSCNTDLSLLTQLSTDPGSVCYQSDSSVLTLFVWGKIPSKCWDECEQHFSELDLCFMYLLGYKKEERWVKNGPKNKQTNQETVAKVVWSCRRSKEAKVDVCTWLQH